MSMRSLVDRLRAEAELMDRDDDDGGGGPEGSLAGNSQPRRKSPSPTRRAGGSPGSKGAATSERPVAAAQRASTARSAWRILVALDHVALRLRRGGTTFVEARLQGLAYHSDLNEEYEGK